MNKRKLYIDSVKEMREFWKGYKDFKGRIKRFEDTCWYDKRSR